MVPDHQNAFDGTVNYNVLDIDGIVESPNPSLYVLEAFPQIVNVEAVPQIVNVMTTHSKQNRFRYILQLFSG